MEFNRWVENLPKYFAADGDMMMSHILAVLSSTFPEGEKFFVRSVAAARDQLTDPQLLADVEGFIGQEEMHGREHQVLNDRLAEHGYPTRGIDTYVRGLYWVRERIQSKKVNLGFTAALEHYTATLAELVLTNEEARNEVGRSVARDILTWHALEESEHKAVAFDVYKAVGGGEFTRIVTMLLTDLLFIFETGIMGVISVAKDRDARRHPVKLARSIVPAAEVAVRVVACGAHPRAVPPAGVPSERPRHDAADRRVATGAVRERGTADGRARQLTSEEARPESGQTLMSTSMSCQGMPVAALRSVPISPVAAMAFVMFTTTLASNAPSPLYVIYQEEFGFSSAVLTLIFASYALAVMVALVALGKVSDSAGRRLVLVPSLAVLGVSAVLFAEARGTAWLVAARIVQGLATGALTAAATAALVELEPAGDRRRASYINTVSFIGGAAGGPLVVGLLAEYAPRPTVMPFVLELLMISVALALMTRVPETVQATSVRWRLQRPSVPPPIRRAFVVAALMLAVSWSVGALYGSLSASIDRQVLHVDNHAVAGLVLFAFAGLGGVSQVLLRHRSSRRTMTMGGLCLCVGMALVGLSLVESSVLLFFLGTVFGGVGGGLTFMGSLALLNDVAPHHRRAEVVAAYNLVGYLALSVPAVGVGTLASSQGLRTAATVFTGAVVAVGLVAVAMTLRLPVEDTWPAGHDALVDLGLEPAVPASGVE